MLTLETIEKSKNLTTELDERELARICAEAHQGYEIDEESRSEWKSRVDDAMKIALQTMEKKNTPWPNASSIKYPLIAEAGINFAARMLPEVIQNNKVVRVAITGNDPEEVKHRRADRVARCLSYQLLAQSPDWVEGVDSLLTILPIVGTVFKKSYYDHRDKCLVDQVCAPDKIVVNYNTPSLDRARRVTHILTMYQNDIIENQRRGLYNPDLEPGDLRPDAENAADSDFPLTVHEQHCYLDLDEDGYKEPYILTYLPDSMKVLRLVPRFEEVVRSKNKLLRIVPTQFFTDYHFIRSPDGGFYSIGFGMLLLPINSAINTLINQLIDSGTLANMQSGFIGRGLRIKNGKFNFEMGKFQVLDVATGTDIAKNVYTFPFKEPSQVLFSMLGLLINVGKQLISSTEALTGSQQAQNVSSNTISQLIEQGSKVFTAVAKRFDRSAQKTYKRLYTLNYQHLSQSEYTKILDDEEAKVKDDFELESADIYPVADPTMSTDNQRLIRAGIVQSLRTVEPRAADQYLLESLHLDEGTIQRLLPPPNPEAPPPPEVQKIMADIKKTEADIALMQAQYQLDLQKLQVEMANMGQQAKESDARINESVSRIWKMQKDAANNENKLSVVAVKMNKQETRKDLETALKARKQNEEIVEKINQNALDAEIEMLRTQIEDKKVNVKAAEVLTKAKESKDNDNS